MLGRRDRIGVAPPDLQGALIAARLWRVTSSPSPGHTRVPAADSGLLSSWTSAPGGRRRHERCRRRRLRPLLPRIRRLPRLAGRPGRRGTELGGPWSDHLEGPVWELRIRLLDVAARITYWCTADGRIVLLTVFRKTRQHDQRQIDRAIRAQKACDRDHRGLAVEIYQRQV